MGSKKSGTKNFVTDNNLVVEALETTCHDESVEAPKTPVTLNLLQGLYWYNASC